MNSANVLVTIVFLTCIHQLHNVQIEAAASKAQLYQAKKM